MFYLYKGENFPPANIQGDCDPFIKFNCYGLDQSSKAIEGSFNPFWKEIIPMQVSLQDVFTTNITKGIVC
jgi:Ca2+-dependent lipid-binding protein